MRAMSKILISLLAIALLASIISPVSAISNTVISQQNCPPSLLELNGLNAPALKNYCDYDKLVHELSLFKKKAIKFFEKKYGAQFVSNPNPDTVGSVNKQLTQNTDGTWNVTIYVTVPEGLYANVYDYLLNLQPIPETFTPISPDVVRDGYVEYDGLTSGTYALHFDASQISSGSVADQVFIREYAFGTPGGFLLSAQSVGWWFDI